MSSLHHTVFCFHRGLVATSPTYRLVVVSDLVSLCVLGGLLTDSPMVSSIYHGGAVGYDEMNAEKSYLMTD